MNKKVVIAFVLVALVAGLSIGVALIYHSVTPVNAKKYDGTYRYEMRFSPGSDAAYRIIVPVLVSDGTGEVSRAMDGLGPQGTNFTATIVDTVYGPGLQLEGHGPVTLVSEGKGAVPMAHLSMRDPDIPSIDSDNLPERSSDSYRQTAFMIYSNGTLNLTDGALHIYGDITTASENEDADSDEPRMCSPYTTEGELSVPEADRFGSAPDGNTVVPLDGWYSFNGTEDMHPCM